jgi:hypothetical protein
MTPSNMDKSIGEENSADYSSAEINWKYKKNQEEMNRLVIQNPMDYPRQKHKVNHRHLIVPVSLFYLCSKF